MQAAVILPPAPETVEPAASAAPEKQIQWKTVVATAYCPHCRVCETTGTTYTGRNAIPDGVAVARRGPRAARLGTKLLVPGRGWLHVDDVGGGVHSNQIDIRVSSHAEAVQFGRRQMRVGVIESQRS
jgi:3D (Asp-Asp-Asp) domain-containing protein